MTTQSPIGSGFSAASTAVEVIAGIDLSGKGAIVTGGYSGLGVETVRALVSAGATVVVPTRDSTKAAATLASISGVEIEPLDLLDPQSIDAFAAGFVAAGRPLHILVNSAGIAGIPLTRDARGYEAHFATNHLGHFQLIVRLWPALQRANGARVVNVSAAAHRYSDIAWDDPHFDRRPYNPRDAYGQSKTANNLCAVEVDRRGQTDGIRAFSLHPGSIITPLSRRTPIELLRAGGFVDDDGAPIINPSRNLKTVEQGAATSVWCATSPRLDGLGGLYCENCEVAPLAAMSDAVATESAPVAGTWSLGVMPYSVNPDAAIRLWALSERLTGVSL